MISQEEMEKRVNKMADHLLACLDKNLTFEKDFDHMWFAIVSLMSVIFVILGKCEEDYRRLATNNLLAAFVDYIQDVNILDKKKIFSIEELAELINLSENEKK